MSNIQVVAIERHAHKRWQRYVSYAHTTTDALALLVLPELSRACIAMPVGFIKAKDKLTPVAVQGLEPGTNLFVDNDGRWLADYVPAAYRSYPFVLGTTQAGEPVLCVHEDSDLVSDTSGEPFFDEHGEQTPILKEVIDFMLQVAAQRAATQRICSLLEEHKLIQPWPFKRKTNEGEQIIEGLYRIDKTALKQLSADAFQKVRLGGALPVIYCQLLSMQHLPKLQRLASTRMNQEALLPLVPGGDLDLEFLNNQGTVSFGRIDQCAVEAY